MDFDFLTLFLKWEIGSDFFQKRKKFSNFVRKPLYSLRSLFSNRGADGGKVDVERHKGC